MNFVFKHEVYPANKAVSCIITNILGVLFKVIEKEITIENQGYIYL